MSELETKEYLPFDEIKQIDEEGNEFWSARDLQMILEYTKWDNFKKVVEKAMLARKHAGNSVFDHFPDVGKMIEIAKKANRVVSDYKLSRYACYLIVQNGDPRKKVIALGQTYFAVQTRRQELTGRFGKLDENNKRLVVRNQISQSNQLLARAAHKANITTNKQFAIFQNHGYRGLYGGLSVSDIHKRKGLEKNEKILDYMGSTELGANLFRITQTEARLTNEDISNPQEANNTHYDVGHKVRDLMVTMQTGLPEDLKTPDKNIQTIEKEEITKIKDFTPPLMLDE